MIGNAYLWSMPGATRYLCRQRGFARADACRAATSGLYLVRHSRVDARGDSKSLRLLTSYLSRREGEEASISAPANIVARIKDAAAAERR